MVEMMERGQIKELLAFAVELVEAAGPIALEYFRRPLDVTDKSGGVWFDPVTQGDREIESFLRAELVRRFPEHGIIGEEEEDREAEGSINWVIDPIDGTRAFMSGMPAWGILLGLTDGDACLAGVMHQPYIGETFFGSAEGARMRRAGDEVELHTSAVAELSSATLYATHPEMFFTEESREAFDRVAAACRLMRYGGDCYSYCLLAMGQIDLVIENGLQPYDIIPLIPIIEGAGGIVTDGQGGPANEGGLVVVAANAKLHEQALELMNAKA